MNERIDALLRFLPALEQSRTPSIPNAHEPGTGGGEVPPVDYGDSIIEFVGACYEYGWVIEGFNWTDWEGHAQDYRREPRLLANVEADTLARLITTHIRRDRFVEGHLASVIADGHMSAILLRLMELRMTTSPNSSQEPADVVSIVDSFNRKERHFVVANAVTGGIVSLDEEFRGRLSSVIRLTIPPGSRSYIDYHFSWLYAAREVAKGLQEGTPRPNEASGVEGNQEDIDLLVAFVERSTTHLVLLEAKGVTNWGNRQLQSKVTRLKTIFGEAGDAFPRVKPHFVLWSPRRPALLSSAEWPDWMKPDDGKPRWLPLRIPDGRRVVTRTDATGTPSSAGAYFKVIRISTPL